MDDTDFKRYLSERKTSSFKETLFSLITKHKLTDVEVYKMAALDRKLFSKIRCNVDYVPKKSNVIKLGLALNLDKTEFDTLLKSAGYSLSSSSFDSIIAYCFENKVYDTNLVNNYLYSYCETTLQWSFLFYNVKYYQNFKIFMKF